MCAPTFVSDGTSFGRFTVPAFIIAYVQLHRIRSPLLIGDLGASLPAWCMQSRSARGWFSSKSLSRLCS